MHALWLRVRGQGRSLSLVAILVFGAVVLLSASEPYYPVGQWLLWHYLALLALAFVALLGAASAGDWMLRRVFRFTLPTHERVALALAIGLSCFEVAMYLLGVVGGYGTTAFCALPVALVLLGLPQWRNYYRRWRALSRLGPLLKPYQVAYVLFGCFALGLIYFSILTPGNVQFDARWKHMALAEDYVAHGGLRRMPEGWVFAARPHLTSFLYVWAFLLPVGSLFHRMELCAHLEFLVFVATTLFGVTALLRRLVPNADPRVVWVARFVFPGIWLYDSSLSAGADHFGALLSPAVALATLHGYRSLNRRWVLCLTLLLAAAIMVKETVAIMLVPVPAMTLLGRALWLTYKSHTRRRTATGLLATTGYALSLGIVATAPFWLTNVVWYNNPVYPSLSHIFASRPWSTLAAYRFEVEYSETNMWAPKRDWIGLIQSLRAVVDFSFLPNDWSKFHGDRPVFGSLFTLLVPSLFWLKGTRRIWAVVLWVQVALFTWYWVHHQDRYLQAVLPLMAAATAGILILIFRQHRPIIRWTVGGLVAVQMAVGADVYFIQTHAMAGSAVKRVVDLLAMGHQGKYLERFDIERKYVALARAIPEGKTILFHDMQSHLGSEHQAVRDVALWQSGLNYSLAERPSDIHRWLREMGVDYIVLNPGKSTGNDRLASDLLFFDFVYRQTRRLPDVEGMHVFRLSDDVPTMKFEGKAIVVQCDELDLKNDYAEYNLSALKRPGIGPLSQKREKPLRVFGSVEEVRQAYTTVDFVVVGAKCDVPAGLRTQFKKVAERPKRGSVPASHLYIRRTDSDDSDDS